MGRAKRDPSFGFHNSNIAMGFALLNPSCVLITDPGFRFAHPAYACYLQDLLDALDTLERWPEKVWLMQKNWISLVPQSLTHPCFRILPLGFAIIGGSDPFECAADIGIIETYLLRPAAVLCGKLTLLCSAFPAKVNPA